MGMGHGLQGEVDNICTISVVCRKAYSKRPPFYLLNRELSFSAIFS